jgi:hypothetical protein
MQTAGERPSDRKQAGEVNTPSSVYQTDNDQTKGSPSKVKTSAGQTGTGQPEGAPDQKNGTERDVGDRYGATKAQTKENSPEVKRDHVPAKEMQQAPDSSSALAEFALGAVGRRVEQAKGLVTDKVDTLQRSVTDHPNLFAAFPPAAVAAAAIEKEAHRLGTKAASQEGSALERWATVINHEYNPAVGAVEHAPEVVNAWRKGDYRAAGAHTVDTVDSVVNTGLAAVGAVEGGKAVAGAAKAEGAAARAGKAEGTAGRVSGAEARGGGIGGSNVEPPKSPMATSGSPEQFAKARDLGKTQDLGMTQPDLGKTKTLAPPEPAKAGSRAGVAAREGATAQGASAAASREGYMGHPGLLSPSEALKLERDLLAQEGPLSPELHARQTAHIEAKSSLTSEEHQAYNRAYSAELGKTGTDSAKIQPDPTKTQDLGKTQSDLGKTAADPLGKTAFGDETIWRKGNEVTGRFAEQKLADHLPGEKFYKNFPNMDRAVYGPGGPNTPALEVGQLKTYDTTAKSYADRPNSLYNKIINDAGELGGVGESSWEHSGHQVEIGPDTRRVLDVVLPEKPLTAGQEAALGSAVKASESMHVEVRIYRLP